MNGLGRKKEETENKSLLFTKETLGVVLILFATLCLVCLITRETVFSVIGQSVNAFLFGCFGFFAYAVDVFAITMGVILVSGKKTGFSRKRKTLVTLFFIAVALLSHVASISASGLNYAEYLSASYQKGAGGVSTASAGGLCTALVAYAFSALLTDVGSFVILGIVIAVLSYALIVDWIKGSPESKPKSASEKFKSSFVKKNDDEIGIKIEGERDYPVPSVEMPKEQLKQKLFVNNANDFAVKGKKELLKDKNEVKGMQFGYVDGGLAVAQSVSANDDLKKKLDYVKTPAKIDMEKFAKDSVANYNSTYLGGDNGSSTTVSDYVNPRQREEKEETPEIPFIEHENTSRIDKTIVTEQEDTATQRAEMFENKYLEVEETQSFVQQPEVNEEIFRPIEIEEKAEEIVQQSSAEIPFIDETEEDEFSSIENSYHDENRVEEQESEHEVETFSASEEFLKSSPEEKTESVLPESNISTRRMRDIFLSEEKEENPAPTETLGFTSRAKEDGNATRRGLNFGQGEQEKVEEKPKKPAPPINRKYNRPPFDLLETYSQPINAEDENHTERMEIIQRTLEEFHINAVPQSYVQGPSVTRYEIMMPAGISVRKVLGYDDDLKMRLAARDGVRIEAPIPGKNLVGIEVANKIKVTVGLKEVMEGLEGKKNKPTALMFAVGKDIVGNSISYDLAKGPHYLIAGATGSGKSVALHVMIVSLLMRYSPEELKLVLVDPKSVEFRKYEHIPHLLVDEIITEPKRALTLLQWAYDETNRRNEMFTSCGGMISNIDDYNTQIANDTIPKLPRVVFIIDELADLMEACKKDLEQRIRMIAAKSRSAGIHLVLATQRPSVDVITGTIKANLPSRIALKVMNFADSQTILGEAGAEKLLGNGDMLYKDSSMADYERYQGAYVSGREVTNIVEYIKTNNTAYFDDDVQEFLDKETRPAPESVQTGDNGGGDADEFDSYFLKALWLAVNSQTVSISQLQRRFQIGYARAGGLVDKMERMGFVSGNEGSKARRVLMTKEEFENRFGIIDDADF